MILDYRDITFSFRDQKKKRRRRRIRLLLILGIVVTVTILFVISGQRGRVGKIEKLLLQGRYSQADTELKKMGGSFLVPHTRLELQALSFLLQGKISPAKELLTELGDKTTRVNYKKFINLFVDKAGYRSLKMYLDYLQQKGENVSLYDALCATASFDHRLSGKILTGIKGPFTDNEEKILSLIQSINQQIGKNRIDYVFDIKARPLAFYDPARKKTVALVPGFDFRSFSLQKGLRFFNLTLDKNIQMQVNRLFQSYEGSFILINLVDSSIVAAYSKSKSSPASPASNIAFSRQYEPGSTLKMVTLMAFLTGKYPDFFPCNCQGNLRLPHQQQSKIFYDWVTHRVIESYSQALFLSCSTCFAQMALKIGKAKLFTVFEQFGFNSPPFTDGNIGFNWGTFNRSLTSEYQLANLSAGLNEVRLTTFHLAHIAALIAREGSMPRPFLIRSIKNILDLGYYNHQPVNIKINEEATVFLKIKNAMAECVENSRGTAYSSRVGWLKTAVKTGTTGDRKSGFNAILMGFFPVARPEYAFAFVLENGGKAQVEGANFLKEFLTLFYNQQ